MGLVPLRTSARGRAAGGRDLRAFLPTTREEMAARGWDELDILIVTGDAYVDHPAFGPVLDRALPRGARLPRRHHRAAARGTTPSDIARMGRPRLFVGVTAGNLDSMLNKLTAQKKVRVRGSVLARRPHRTCARTAPRIVYSNLCRQAFPGLPIVLGGIEASLRRIAHYDYWSRLRCAARSCSTPRPTCSSSAWASAPAWEIARRLDAGEHDRRRSRDMRGTAHVKKNRRAWEPLARGREPLRDRRQARRPAVVRGGRAPTSRPSREMSRSFQFETNAAQRAPAPAAARRRGGVLQPARARRSPKREMDGLYDLPFARAPAPELRRRAHPRLRDGEALDRHDARLLRRLHVLQHHRARGAHHPEPHRRTSVLREVRALSRMDDFRGVDHRLGGPTANMYKMTLQGRARPRARAAASRACTRASARTS